ncbi:MAG: hypothetical protein WB681_07505 [Candidatus Cybelea sp.]
MGILARYAFSIGAAAALLAGCGGMQRQTGASGTLPALTGPQHIVVDPDYKVSSGLLYVALFNPGSSSNKVQVYNTKAKDPTPIASITDGVEEPQSVCLDGEGILYVVNGPGWVSEYSLGKTKPFQTITQGIDGPAFCAVDGSGNLWVTNVNGPNVVEYLKGSTVPHTTITKGIIYPVGIAIDHGGNMYVANRELNGTTNVQVYPQGSKSPSRTITDGITWPVGIAVDANATLYVTNTVSPGSVQEFRAGQSYPYRAITKEMNGPTAVTFAPSGRMYLTNTETQGGSGPAPAILEYRPGWITPTKKMITNGLAFPLGTAYYPALLP